MIATRLSALAFAAMLGVSAAAQAQMSPPPPPPPGMASMGGMERHGGADMGDHHAMHAHARLKALHDALNIRPDQEQAFAAFAASMRPPEWRGGPGREDGGPKAAAGGMMHDQMATAPMTMAPMTTPERLDMMAKRMDEHFNRMRERFERHAAAVKGLYAVLSPEQKHTFDALPALMGHPGMGPGFGGPGMMGGPGMGPHEGMEHGSMGMGHPGDAD